MKGFDRASDVPPADTSNSGAYSAMSKNENPASGSTLDRAYSEIAGRDEGINNIAATTKQSTATERDAVSICAVEIAHERGALL
jgi:hypothetical protein